VVLDGIDWPTPAVTAPDVVAIGPGGVFVVVVIDSREQPATVLLDAPWVEGEFRGDLVERAAAAAAAVLGLVPGVDPAHVWPVLCFDQERMLLERCDQVLVCSTANLVSLMTSRFPVLNTRQVHTIHARLRAGIRRASASLRYVPAQPTSRPPSRRRSHVLAAAALTAGLAVSGGVVLAVTDVGAIGQAARSLVDRGAPLGRPVDLTGPGGQVRVSVRGTQPVGDRAGVRLVAVDLLLAAPDGGQWRGSPAGSVWLVDGDGTRFRATPGATLRATFRATFRATLRSGSEVLPAEVWVRPGHPVHGRVLVEVPRRSDPALVEVRVGDGRHGSARWKLR
jgi:hypothetical protein